MTGYDPVDDGSKIDCGQENLKVSVLTPSFNAVGHIERAIQSVLAQNYPQTEHIVVDGGSDDGTVDVLRKYSHIIWISEPDRGQSDAMNKAMSLATGDLIVFLNADDVFHPETFGVVADAAIAHPNANIFVGGLKVKTASDCRTVFPEISFKSLILRQAWWPVNPVSYFVRQELQRRIGNFPIHDHYTMDLWWMLRCLRIARPHYIRREFGTFNCLGGNKTSNEAQSEAAIRRTRRRFLLSPAGWPYLLRLAIVSCQKAIVPRWHQFRIRLGRIRRNLFGK